MASIATAERNEVKLGPRGSEIMAAFKAARVEFIASVPDITTSHGLLWPLSRRDDFTLVRLCKEDEGVSVCAGLAYWDRRAILLIQHTGFLDAMNAVRAIALDYEQPICMVIGLQGKEPDVLPSQSASNGVRMMEPILDTMGIDRLYIGGSGDVAALAPAIDRAYRLSRPLAALIGRKVLP